MASAWNPNTVRRCVRVTDVTNDGIVTFVSKSFTREDKDDKYHVHIDAHTHEVVCDCPDFRYRKAKHHPTVESPEAHLCKHGLRAIANLKRKGLAL